MATLDGLTAAALEKVYGLAQVERPAVDTTDGAFNAGASSLPVLTDSMWKRGAVAEFADGDLVTLVTDASGTATVLRSVRGVPSLDTNHASGSVILRDPPFTVLAAQQAVSEVVRNDLWPHVWSWHQDSFSFVEATHMYALDEHVVDVVLVYQGNLNADEQFHPIDNGLWDVERQIAATFATEGTLLRVARVHDQNEDVHYIGKRRPHVDDLANLSDDIADIVPWAAAAKLLASRSGPSKQDAARGKKVEDGAFQRDYRGLMAEFLRMRGALALQLQDEVRVEPKFRPRSRRSW